MSSFQAKKTLGAFLLSLPTIAFALYVFIPRVISDYEIPRRLNAHLNNTWIPGTNESCLTTFPTAHCASNTTFWPEACREVLADCNINVTLYATLVPLILVMIGASCYVGKKSIGFFQCSEARLENAAQSNISMGDYKRLTRDRSQI